MKFVKKTYKLNGSDNTQFVSFVYSAVSSVGLDGLALWAAMLAVANIGYSCLRPVSFIKYIININTPSLKYLITSIFDSLTVCTV